MIQGWLCPWAHDVSNTMCARSTEAFGQGWVGRKAWRLGVLVGLLAAAGSGILLIAFWPGHSGVGRSRGNGTALDLKDWDASAARARETLRTHPNDVEALRLLARASVRLGRLDPAIAIYTQRMSEKALEVEDYVLLGWALEQRGKTAAAAVVWDKVLGFTSIPPDLVDEFARLQLWYQRLDAAAAAAKRLSTQPGWESRGRMILGLALVGKDDITGAAEVFRAALHDDPSAVETAPEPLALRKLIARTFLVENRPTEALPELEAVLAHGADAEASWLLSRAQLRLGNKEQARLALAAAGSYRASNPLEPEPGPYVGAAQCERCHRAVFDRSRGSRHTRSYYRGDELLQLPRPREPWIDPDDPGVTHTIRESGGKLREETRIGDKVVMSVIEYAFGTSDRSVTMVSRDPQGTFHTVRMSYYRSAEGEGWDRSLLDTLHPDRSRKYEGETLEVRDGVVRCLYCHATNPRPRLSARSPESADQGIGCERCHGPGGDHIAAVEAGLPDLAIVNAAAVSPAVATAKQCNECHILGKNFEHADPQDPGWLRSAGVGWTWSRCNIESEGAFGCVTCHDPHASARSISTEQYEAKCLGCHAGSSNAAASKSGRAQGGSAAKKNTVCPVSPARGCLECHMPRVRVKELHADLTDHYIRIRRPGGG